MQAFRVLALISVLSLVAGCKVAVMVVEGGEVQSVSSGTCQPATPGVAGAVCIHEVTDTNYSETFTAVPDTGWEFVKWNSGGDFRCADSASPTCVISNVGTAGIAPIEAIIASDTTYYIMPLFTEVGAPIVDTITVDGREWAQVDLFANLSWNDVNAVCPGGVCNGMLNGHDMRGWTWASVEDINALFDFYIGLASHGSTPFVIIEIDSTWAPQFFSAGWRPSYINEQGIELSGHIRGESSPELSLSRYGRIRDEEPAGSDAVATNSTYYNYVRQATRGAWFFRAP